MTVYTADRRKFLKLVAMGTISATILNCMPNMPSVSENPNQLSESDKTRLERHYKVTLGDKEISLPTKPFIKLPTKEYFPVAQGWNANPDETKIDGVKAHWAIDLKTPYGTPLFAPIKGILIATIVASWRTVPSKNDPKVEEQVFFNGDPKLPISYEGGISIEIIAEDGQRVQILHQGSLDKSLGKRAFSKPKPGENGELIATGIQRSLPQLEQMKLGVPVEVGQPIGTVGYSGLGINHLGVIYNGEDWPPEIPEGTFKTWDPIGAHPHIATHFRDENGRKYAIRDIFSIYGDTKDYTDSKGRLKVGKDALVLTDKNGLPLLAA